MGLFEHWPYTNFHDLNLNWIISEIKKISEKFKTIDQAIEKLQELIDEAGIVADTGHVQNQTVDTAVLQMIYNAAKSYETDAWHIADHGIDYGNYLDNNPSGLSGTPIDPVGRWSQCNRIDCSSFVILCLMGIPYNATAFNGTNELQPRTTFNRYYKYKPTRNPDGLLRWSSDIYEMADKNQMLYKINNISDLRTGDVVFYKYTDAAWDDLPDNDFAKIDGGSYGRVAHVAIAVDNCSAFDSGVGIIQCVDTAAITDFRDINDYDPTRLELVGYAMRPWKIKPKGHAVFSGFTTLRKAGSYTDPNVSLAEYEFSGGSGHSFSGGRIPTDALPGSIDLSTGEYDGDDTGHLTTGFIPYSAALVVENPLTGTEYRCFYYDENEGYISYTTSVINRPSNAKLVRLEFRQTNNAPLTPAQEEYLIDNVIIRYHIMADELSAQESDPVQNTDADTYYYFTDGATLMPKVEVNN